jgi:hypothetical protein
MEHEVLGTTYDVHLASNASAYVMKLAGDID